MEVVEHAAPVAEGESNSAGCDVPGGSLGLERGERRRLAALRGRHGEECPVVLDLEEHPSRVVDRRSIGVAREAGQLIEPAVRLSIRPEVERVVVVRGGEIESLAVRRMDEGAVQVPVENIRRVGIGAVATKARADDAGHAIPAKRGMTQPLRRERHPCIAAFAVAAHEDEALTRSSDSEGRSIPRPGQLRNCRRIRPEGRSSAFEIVEIPACCRPAQSAVGNRETLAIGEPRNLANVQAQRLELAHGAAFHVLNPDEAALGIGDPSSVRRQDTDGIAVPYRAHLFRRRHVAKTGGRRGSRGEEYEERERSQASHRGTIVEQRPDRIARSWSVSGSGVASRRFSSWCCGLPFSRKGARIGPESSSRSRPHGITRSTSR